MENPTPEAFRAENLGSTWPPGGPWGSHACGKLCIQIWLQVQVLPVISCEALAKVSVLGRMRRGTEQVPNSSIPLFFLFFLPFLEKHLEEEQCAFRATEGLPKAKLDSQEAP